MSLYHKNQLYVSENSIEHKGSAIDISQLVGVFISKDGGERRGVIWGGIIALIALYCILGWGWVTFGLIVFVLAGGWAGFMAYKIKSDQIECFLTITFAPTRTGNLDAFVVHYTSYTEAEEAMKAVRKAENIYKNS